MWRKQSIVTSSVWSYPMSRQRQPLQLWMTDSTGSCHFFHPPDSSPSYPTANGTAAAVRCPPLDVLRKATTSNVFGQQPSVLDPSYFFPLSPGSACTHILDLVLATDLSLYPHKPPQTRWIGWLFRFAKTNGSLLFPPSRHTRRSPSPPPSLTHSLLLSPLNLPLSLHRC